MPAPFEKDVSGRKMSPLFGLSGSFDLRRTNLWSFNNTACTSFDASQPQLRPAFKMTHTDDDDDDDVGGGVGSVYLFYLLKDATVLSV